MSTENRDSSAHWVGAQQDSTQNMKVLIDAADRDLQSKYASSGGYRDVRLTTELPCRHGVESHVGWRRVILGMRRTV
jgi:hypothetical protein